ncbi:MAG: hypothetical protein ACFCUM_14980 [Bacteroidales bacterium]
MAKVFRFHKGQDISGWEQTSPLAPNEIAQIEDPDGLSPIRQITSIPSPFARVDLVLTAFMEVTKSGTVHGSNVFYKMVSDALDIGQVFFNLDICEDVNIVAWDKSSDLEILRKSNNARHRHLGDTLKLFLDQDSVAYNFERLNRIYILCYSKENDDLRVLGGTSPSTLFFSSSNDLEKIYKKNFGTDTLFNNDYKPLYLREPDYIKYLYSLRASNPVKFREYFSSFSDYLDMNYGLLPDSLKSVITSMDVDYARRNFNILTTGKDGDNVEANGINLYRNITDNSKIESESDFVIDSTVYTGLKPLVLPNSKITTNSRYIWENWSPDHTAPFLDQEVPEKRYLPYIGIQYPYLTVSDFLQPYIIRLEFPVNNERYYNGNPADNISAEDSGYLPPLKKEFFRYFKKDDLKRYHANNKPFFEMTRLAGGTIEVTLRIPVKNGYTTFSRKYENRGKYSLADKPSEEKNQGFIVDHSIDMAIFPFLEFTGETDGQFYRIGLADKDNQPVRMNNSFKLNFYDQSRPVARLEKIRAVNKSSKTGAEAGFDVYAVEDKFDFMEIEVNKGEYHALIIPWFKKEAGSNQFTFAVDFGTTYSHIEFRRNSEAPRPLEITDAGLQQIEKLHHPSFESNISPEFREIFVFNLIPDLIGKRYEYFFPIRTAVAEKTELDKFSEAVAMGDLNIPFIYEKMPVKRYQRITTELKWQTIHGDDRPRRRIEAFVESFLMIIKAFVILNQGDLSKTRLIWLYPASMNRARRDLLADIWNRNVKKYIPSIAEKPGAMSESIAPYYYFRSSQDASSYDQPAVSIDIGGETTDVVFFRDNKPAMMTSFRFAGNALFSSADNISSDNNGFVKAFSKIIYGHLKNTGSADLMKVFEEINNSHNARDVINFYFSLENNLKINETNRISFLNMLQGSKEFRIVFLLFYTAIVYHVATIFRQKRFELPRHISFSGTASKLLKVITTNNDTLTRYTIRLFEIVCDRKYHSDGLNIHSDEKNPKQVTCKGALIENREPDNLTDIRYINYGVDGLFFPETKIRYCEIDEKMKNSVIAEYEKFLEFFLELGRDIDITNTFDIPENTIQKHLQELRRDVKSHLSSRIADTFENEESEEQILEESLFFLPLAGTIKKLISKIGSDLQ